MAVTALPSYANIRELRLSVVTRDNEAKRALTRKQPFALQVREMWQGQVLFRNMSPPQVHELLATFEGLKGRVEPFKLELKAGKFSRTCPVSSGTLAAVPVRGQNFLTLNLGAGGGTIRRGTLIGLGDIEAGPYQLFEVTADAAISTATNVEIAPRVRYGFAGSTPATVGTVFALLKMASDTITAQVDLTSGAVTANVVESL